MAAAYYRCNADQTDRISLPTSTLVGGIRIRPNETVVVDLAVPEQSAAFNVSKYTLLVETPTEPPINPFV